MAPIGLDSANRLSYIGGLIPTIGSQPRETDGFFDIAADWHRIYALSLDMRIGCKDTELASTTDCGVDTLCYLGRWIYGPGQSFSTNPHYQELKFLHAEFHRIAAEMLDRHAQGHHAAAEAIRTGSYRLASDAVVQAIDLLSADSGFVSPAPPLDTGTQQLLDEFSSRCSTQVGVEVIDQQHQLLARMATVLLRHFAALIRTDEIREMLAELTAAIELHYDTEEAYMRSRGMSKTLYERHVAEHTQILDALYRVSANAGNISHLRVAELQPYLSRWFVAHILDYDYELRKLSAAPDIETA